MSTDHKNDFHTRALTAYARLIITHPGRVLAVLLVVFAASIWATTKLTINSNQLDLIDQNLPEVKEVKRIIDIVGGAGHLIIGLRGEDPVVLRKVADDLDAYLEADDANVRTVTYKLPVDFIKKNMVLFVDTEDLSATKNKLTPYLKDQIRRASPFFFEIVKTDPLPRPDVSDILTKYSHVGKKSVADDYYGTDDGHMLLMFVKPMWDSNDLAKTKNYLKKLYADIDAYSKNNKNGVKVEESYKRDVPPAGLITYGLTGSYKMSVDDSYAIEESLGPVTIYAFVAILLITIVFFRKIMPTFISIFGMVIGTVLSMGFAKVAIGELNMVTSILGGILMGFGVDYGIQFIYRTRIELGMKKAPEIAIRDALIHAGRPASVAAIVTGGSFFVLLVSKFRGFSQFGLLAGFGTIIIGFTLFCWSPALLALIARWRPELVARLIGVTEPPRANNEFGERRIPRPGLLLTVATVITAAICAFAVPWTALFGSDSPAPATESGSPAASGKGRVMFGILPQNPRTPQPDLTFGRGRTPTMWERLKTGVRFNYNTRALLPEEQHSVELQDEINDKYRISADPVAVFSKDLAEAKEVYEELIGHPEKYTTVDQVLSIYTFVPPADIAAENAKILEQWQADLGPVNPEALPADAQENAKFFQAALAARPFTVEQVPEIYAKQFMWLPSTKPENRGYLTFIYPRVDLRDGKLMMKFVDEVHDIKTASGKVYHAAGLPVLFALLAQMVLGDGYTTVILATIWILLMHYLDFRSIKLAAASVIPLGVGLVMMMGFMSISNHQLNFMNIIILPILLGFGVSHGLYLLHRFLEGTSPVVALSSVGAAVASSTLTAIAGFGALFAAAHNGLKSMGFVACLGLTTTLVVSFTVLAAVLELIHEGRVKSDIPTDSEKET